MGDICWDCDGACRDFLSGAKCKTCNGYGWIEREDPDERDYDDEPDEPA